MDFFYLIGGAAVLLMTFLLHRFGNAWIDRLYASHRDILTFPSCSLPPLSFCS